MMFNFRCAPLAVLMIAFQLLCVSGFVATSPARSSTEPYQLSPPRVRQMLIGTQEAAIAEGRRLSQRMEELYAKGQYEDAIPLAERVLSIYERAFDAEHPEVAVALNNLATLYRKKSDFVRAEPMLLRALNIVDKRLGTDHPLFATVLNNLGTLYQDKNDYDRAEPLLLRALAIVEKKFGPENTYVATTLFNLGVLYKARGDYTRAESFLLRALAIQEKVPGVANLDVANTLNNLGMVYQERGDYSRAEGLLVRALKIDEDALGADNPETLSVLNNLATLYKIKGDYQRAETTFLKVLSNLENKLGAEDPEVATIISNLGVIYLTKGDYVRSESFLLRALAMLEKRLGPDHLRLATVLNNLAELYRVKGDFVRSEAMFLRALKIDEEVLGSDHPAVALMLNNLSLLYQAKGDYVHAEPLYLRALAIREKKLGVDHTDVAVVLNNLARMYEEKGDLGRIEPLLLRARKIFENAPGADQSMVAAVLHNLAEFYVFKGDFAHAEPLYLRGLEITEKAFGVNNANVALALNNVSGLYRYKGDYGRSELLLLRALKISEAAFGNDHPNVALILNNLALIYLAMGDYVRATRVEMRGIEVSEHNLLLILNTGSENQKRDYITTLESETALATSLHLQFASNIPEASRLALTTILRRKGRALDAMTDQIGGLRRRLDPQDRVLLDEFSQVNSQLATLTIRGVGQTDQAQYLAEIARLQARKEQLEGQVSARNAEFRAQAAPVMLERVQQAIPTGAALVEMVLYFPLNAKNKSAVEQWGKPRYAAYVLRRDGNPIAVDIGEVATIDQSILKFRASLSDPKSTDVKQIARELDELVMRPVRYLLGETRTVLLSPDGQLNLVPFAALVDENGHYLLENYTINYLTSGRDLLRLEAQSQQRQQPIVFANPTFDVGVTSNDAKTVKTADVNSRRSIDFNTARVSPLPGTAQEAVAIKNIMPAAQLFTERAATESALKGVAGPRFLHVATHGFFLQDQPQTVFGGRRIGQFEKPVFVPGENPLLRSGLVFAGVTKGQSGAGEDGVLTALEASGLDLWGTKLVVLSACDTGVGQVANGDGVYGLRRALVLAGAESQLMTLWQVSDTATKDLIVDYYTRLQRGDGRADAIRSAQLSMLTGKEMKANVQDRRITGSSVAAVTNRSHPYYWASFIPIGDWRSINDSKTTSLGELFRPQTTVPLTADISGDSPDRRRPVVKSRVSKERVAVTEKPPVKDNPKSFDAQMRAAAKSRQLGNLAEAASYLESAIALKPNDVSALTEMGNIKYDLGDFIGASSFYKRSLAIQPNNAMVRADLGNTYFNQPSPDYTSAIEEYRKALRISPKDERILHNLAVAALQKKSELTARDAINQLAEINPSHPNLTMLRSALTALVTSGKQVSFVQTMKVVAMHE